MVILVNLQAADARRRHMTSQLAQQGIGWQRVGIDLRTCSAEAVREQVRRIAPHIQFDATRLSGAEIGCWLSHLAAWQSLFADAACTAGTVIEDDIVLAPDFADAIAALVADMRWQVVFLGTSSRNLSRRRRVAVGGFAVHKPLGPVFNTWGYVIRRDYAQRMLAGPSPTIAVPIDHVLGGKHRVLRPTLGVVQPARVTEDEELGQHSQIEPHTRRVDRWRVVGAARRRLLASTASAIYYSIYRLL
jgi:glycosyl transferase family 25